MPGPYSGIPDGEARIIEYIQQRQQSDIEALACGDTDTFTIDCEVLEEYDSYLWEFIQHNPDRWDDSWWTPILNIYDETCDKYEGDDDWEIHEVDWPDDWPGIPAKFSVELSNIPDSALMDIGEPRTDRLGEYVKIRGVVRQLSTPMTKVKQAVFECQRCGTQHRELASGDEVEPPYECQGCEMKGPWARITSDEHRVDFQEMHIQEEPGEATDTSNPRVMVVKIEGTELTDSAVPGDRVEVSGYLKEELDDQKAVLMDASMEALAIESEEEDFESLELTDEEIQEFEELSEREDLLEIFMQTLAPDIYGLELAKKALLLQLFGGVTRYEDDPRRTTKGGEIHQAWVGDPGSGKSKLAEHGRRVAPRSVKTVGKGATDAGMTASAVKKEIAGSTEWTLEAGALVLADKGFITIDELDKAGDEVQKALHEALADREVSIDKAGLDVTLKSRTSSLMIANPVNSRFDPYEALIDQFGLSDSLLDRADLVITFQDKPEEERDSALADTVLDSHWGDASADVAVADGSLVESDGLLPVDAMRKYIAYARREYEPDATPEAKEKVKDFWLTIRGLSDEDTIAVTARAIEALRKFAEARARLRLSDTVTVTDVEAVIEMFMESYKKVGIDPDTEQFDADRYAGRKASSDRETLREWITQMTKELGGSDYGAPKVEVVEEVGEVSDADEDEIRYVIDKMQKQGDLYEPAKDELAVPGGGG